VSAPDGGGHGSSHRPQGRPEWLKDWIANQGRWVLLGCGCREDINCRGVMIIHIGLAENEVYCSKHDLLSPIVKAIKLDEYWQLKLPEQSDVPPF
jgi:hypothetical protein